MSSRIMYMLSCFRDKSETAIFIDQHIRRMKRQSLFFVLVHKQIRARTHVQAARLYLSFSYAYSGLRERVV